MSVLWYLVIMLISLSLGAIGVGIYIVKSNSDQKNNKNNPKGEPRWSVATVTMIMVTSLLVGLLGCGIYYGITYKPKELGCSDFSDSLKGSCCPKCEKCIWGPGDVQKFQEAQDEVDMLRAKANEIPRHIHVTADCDNTELCAAKPGGCCGVKKENLIKERTPTPDRFSLPRRTMSRDMFRGPSRDGSRGDPRESTGTRVTPPLRRTFSGERSPAPRTENDGFFDQ